MKFCLCYLSRSGHGNRCLSFRQFKFDSLEIPYIQKKKHPELSGCLFAYNKCKKCDLGSLDVLALVLIVLHSSPFCDVIAAMFLSPLSSV